MNRPFNPPRKRIGAKQTGPDPAAECTHNLPQAADQALQNVTPGAVQKVAKSGELIATDRQKLAEMYGVRDPKLAMFLIDQATQLQASWSNGDASDKQELALTTLLEMRPKTLIEAMLAVQTIAVHHRAVKFLGKATIGGEPYSATDVNLARATSLMRLFADQLEALQKLKGQSGQQKMTVEHIHVNAGGQAIVGNVNAKGSERGEGDKDEK